LKFVKDVSGIKERLERISKKPPLTNSKRIPVVMAMSITIFQIIVRYSFILLFVAF